MADPRNLADLISDMEDDIHEMVGLAAAVRTLGDRMVGQECPAIAVHAVGISLEAVADRIKDCWQDGFTLSHPE